MNNYGTWQYVVEGQPFALSPYDDLAPLPRGVFSPINSSVGSEEECLANLGLKRDDALWLGEPGKVYTVSIEIEVQDYGGNNQIYLAIAGEFGPGQNQKVYGGQVFSNPPTDQDFILSLEKTIILKPEEGTIPPQGKFGVGAYIWDPKQLAVSYNVTIFGQDI